MKILVKYMDISVSMSIVFTVCDERNGDSSCSCNQQCVGVVLHRTRTGIPCTQYMVNNLTHIFKFHVDIVFIFLITLFAFNEKQDNTSKYVEFASVR